MTCLDYLRRGLREILLVLHVALYLSDSLLVARNLHLLIEIHLLRGLFPVEFQDVALLLVNLRLDAEPGKLLEYPDPVGIPCRLDEGVERLEFVMDFVQLSDLMQIGSISSYKR